MFETIEYHCPDCGSITPVMVGIVACLGCGRLLPIIQVDDPAPAPIVRGTTEQGGYFHWQRWFWRDRVSVSVCCFPHHWGFHWRENGARADEVLDTTLVIGPWSFNLTVWDFSRIGRFIRWVPRGRGGRGHLIGW